MDLALLVDSTFLPLWRGKGRNWGFRNKDLTSTIYGQIFGLRSKDGWFKNTRMMRIWPSHWYLNSCEEQIYLSNFWNLPFSEATIMIGHCVALNEDIKICLHWHLILFPTLHDVYFSDGSAKL